MNKVLLVGNICTDINVRTVDMASSQIKIARFTLACNRRAKDSESDFISCVAFDKSADFIEKYFSKGKKIGISGRIQTGSYQKQDGSKVYTTDVVVEEAEFVEKRENPPSSHQIPPAQNNGGYSQGFYTPTSNDGLPFN